MTITFLPIWITDVGGALLMIVFSFLCVYYAVLLRRRDPQNIVWAYLLWVCIALALFAVSRSIGHIVKQLLILSGHYPLWEPIRPYSGAMNTLTFMMVGAVTLFFERTWKIYGKIIKDRQALTSTHEALVLLNQNLEERVSERTRALTVSENRYRRIFEASKDMIAVTRQDGRILDINPAGRLMLGFAPHLKADCMAPFAEMFRYPQDWQGIIDHLLRHGSISSAEFDLKNVQGDGKRVLLSANLAGSANGKDDGIHFLVKDIEQQHVMREQLARADKLASIGELSSGIAHEINNPLGIILGYTQLMLRNEPKDSDRAADLKTIEKQVRHCKSIVEDLLNFARTSAPSKEMCDIHGLIDDVLHFIRQHSAMEGIQVRTDYDRRVGRILLDEKKMRQVFINLLMNARHAVGTQGTITVSTELTADGRKVRIRVRDTGPGIEAKYQARIFDPFFTTKPTGQGTGLGLSVSYGIIKNHGGDIWVESTPGQGAVFTVVLPIAAASDGRLPHEPEPTDR
jgi:two-component system, NtrC family, sensor kinase